MDRLRTLLQRLEEKPRTARDNSRVAAILSLCDALCDPDFVFSLIQETGAVPDENNVANADVRVHSKRFALSEVEIEKDARFVLSVPERVTRALGELPVALDADLYLAHIVQCVARSRCLSQSSLSLTPDAESEVTTTTTDVPLRVVGALCRVCCWRGEARQLASALATAVCEGQSTAAGLATLFVDHIVCRRARDALLTGLFRELDSPSLSGGCLASHLRDLLGHVARRAGWMDDTEENSDARNSQTKTAAVSRPPSSVWARALFEKQLLTKGHGRVVSRLLLSVLFDSSNGRVPVGITALGLRIRERVVSHVLRTWAVSESASVCTEVVAATLTDSVLTILRGLERGDLMKGGGEVDVHVSEGVDEAATESPAKAQAQKEGADDYDGVGDTEDDEEVSSNALKSGSRLGWVLDGVTVRMASPYRYLHRMAAVIATQFSLDMQTAEPLQFPEWPDVLHDWESRFLLQPRSLGREGTAVTASGVTNPSSATGEGSLVVATAAARTGLASQRRPRRQNTPAADAADATLPLDPDEVVDLVRGIGNRRRAPGSDGSVAVRAIDSGEPPRPLVKRFSDAALPSFGTRDATNRDRATAEKHVRFDFLRDAIKELTNEAPDRREGALRSLRHLLPTADASLPSSSHESAGVFHAMLPQLVGVLANGIAVGGSRENVDDLSCCRREVMTNLIVIASEDVLPLLEPLLYSHTLSLAQRIELFRFIECAATRLSAMPDSNVSSSGTTSARNDETPPPTTNDELYPPFSGATVAKASLHSERATRRSAALRRAGRKTASNSTTRNVLAERSADLFVAALLHDSGSSGHYPIVSDEGFAAIALLNALRAIVFGVGSRFAVMMRRIGLRVSPLLLVLTRHANPAVRAAAWEVSLALFVLWSDPSDDLSRACREVFAAHASDRVSKEPFEQARALASDAVLLLRGCAPF